jgi:transcriptional regulator with XRE-family HTH domain
MAMTSDFGQALKRWRTQRGKTQLELALTSGFSQRHVSFLESGRSRPSRSTVVILAESLGVPVKERNALLHAAGFASLYSQEPLDSGRLHHALAALETVVQSHRPFPALVVDRAWNTLGGNDNAFALFRRFIDRPPASDASSPLNAMGICVDPAGLRPCILNWAQFMATLVVHLRQELAWGGDHPDLRALVEQIESDPEYRAHGRDAAETVATPVATLSLARDGIRVDLFTLLSAFATAHDASLSDLRVETFFPTDDASRAVLLAIDAELTAANPARVTTPPMAAWRRTA